MPQRPPPEPLQVVKQRRDETLAALVGSSLPAWTQQCNDVNASCEADWMATIGAKLGL